MVSIESFCKEYNISEDEFYGRSEINDDLYIGWDIPDGFNPNVEGNLEIFSSAVPTSFNPSVKGDFILYNVTTLHDGFTMIVGGSASLNELTHVPNGFTAVVGRSLNMRMIVSICENFAPIVGGWLNLGRTRIIEKGFAPKVKGSLSATFVTAIREGYNALIEEDADFNSLVDIHEDTVFRVGGDLTFYVLTNISESVKFIVGGCLYFHMVKTLPSAFNPIVGCSLYIDCVEVLPENLSLTIGCGLRVSNLKSISKGVTANIGGYINLPMNSNIEIDTNAINVGEVYKAWETHTVYRGESTFMSWDNGKYIMVDFMMCEVLHRRGNIYKCTSIGRHQTYYIVTDGNGVYAHGSSVREANESLAYKISSRDTSPYTNLTLDDVLTHDDAIICYRRITGACVYGTNDFIKNDLRDNNKSDYTIREIIELTKNQYGNIKFRDFFESKSCDVS